jgi:hypothetical protein
MMSWGMGICMAVLSGQAYQIVRSGIHSGQSFGVLGLLVCSFVFVGGQQEGMISSKVEGNPGTRASMKSAVIKDKRGGKGRRT